MFCIKRYIFISSISIKFWTLIFGDHFVFYDINDPLGGAVKNFKGDFDFVIADPPFWLEEYLEKLLDTINRLKSKNSKTLVCAGPPMIPFMTDVKGFQESFFTDIV